MTRPELDPDPDSNYVNRPINSLRTILLGWSPNTYAPQTQRIACVDVVLRACPQVGWQLLVKLLPRHHDSSSPTQHPKLRDLAPKVPEEITFGLVWDFEVAIVSRAVTAAGEDEDRIATLVDAFGSFQPASRASVLAHVDSYLKSHQTPNGCRVWHALREEAARHEYFSDSEWAMTNEERASIAEVVERHRPVDPLVQDRQAFDDWLPHIGKYQAGTGDFTDPDEVRKEVLERILGRDGVAGILRLARMVKLPNLIGPALGKTSVSLNQLFELLEGALDPSVPRELAFYVSAVGAEKFGDEWKDSFSDRVLVHVRSDSVKAHLLLGWPRDEKTWSLVDSLGSEVREQYWSQTHSLPIHGTLDQLLFAVDQLRMRNRHLDVLGHVHMRLKDLPTDLIQDLLGKGASQAGEASKRMGNMLPYYVAQTLSELRRRNDLPDLEIAKIEYAYLPLLRYEKQPLTIVGLMATDADLFVDVLSHVFRGKNAEPKVDVTDDMKARASASHDLLMMFKTVPGINGSKVDLDALAAWVSQARSTAAAKDLSEICDIYIGHVLAHAPNDPAEAIWPPSAVCRVIETTASAKLESGFSTECFNKRGVYSKAINEGGGQERDLAALYLQWADSTHQYPRTSATLAAIAEGWTRRAADEDTRAEQGKLKI